MPSRQIKTKLLLYRQKIQEKLRVDLGDTLKECLKKKISFREAAINSSDKTNSEEEDERAQNTIVVHLIMLGA